MTWAIIKIPHPLDAVWDRANEELGDACELTVGRDDAITAATMTIMALPARNLADSIQKLDVAGIDRENPRADCDLQAIMNEACDLIDTAVARGLRLYPNQIKEA